ncbi:MAG TPA: oligosaccharide flippase family protein [Pelolinea sp.]|nr:oligosaccharide flippase family protein [Pelolinea sp.]
MAQKPKNPTLVSEKSNSSQKFFADVAKMLTGNGLAQFLRVLLSPVISRLYSPAAFGILQNFSSLGNILSVLSALRYEATILLPKKDSDAATQLSISFLILTLFFLLSTPIIYFSRSWLADLLNSPGLENYVWLAPLLASIITAYTAFRQWISRKGKYLQVSSALVINEVVSDGATAGMGFLGFANSSTMILSRFFGQLLSTIFLGVSVIKEDLRIILNNCGREKIISGIKQYKKFPLYNIWASFFNNVSLYMPGLLLSAYFSPVIAGYYSLGQNVIRLPIQLASGSIGLVFFQRSAKAYHEGNLAHVVFETFSRLVSYGLFPMLLILVIGQELFVVVFGAQWGEAGVYAQILSIWSFIMFLVTPLSCLTNILGRNEVSLVLNVIGFFTRLVSFLIGGALNNPRLSLILFSSIDIIIYGIYIFWSTTLSGVTAIKTVETIFSTLLVTGPFILLLLIFKFVNPLKGSAVEILGIPLSILSLLVVSAILAVIYYLMVIFRDKSIRDSLSVYVKRIGRK